MAEQRVISACMFRREWLEVAQQMIPDAAARAEFYEGIFGTAFAISGTEPKNPVARAMWAMACPAITQDRERYDAKCEKNRQNALARSERKRTQANASENERTQATAANTNTNTNNNANTNNNNNANLSHESSPEEVREKETFLIYCTLFGKGVLDVQAEYDAFYGYYDSLGWRNNKGAAITSRVSAALMWKANTELAADAPYRTKYAAAFKNAPTTSVHIWTAYRYTEVREVDGVQTACISLALPEEHVRSFDEKFTAQIRKYARSIGAEDVTYRMVK